MSVTEAWAAQRLRVVEDSTRLRSMRRQIWVDRWNIELDTFWKEVQEAWGVVEFRYECVVWQTFSRSMRIIFWGYISKTPKTLKPAGSLEDPRVFLVDPVNRWLKATSEAQYSRKWYENRLLETNISQFEILVREVRESLAGVVQRLFP